jgi:starch phosphorylase
VTFDIPPVAYFSMEIGLEPEMPTYAGGLGMLAGDTLRAAADLGVPLIGITLLYRQGYFHQQLDAHGRQSESPMPWTPEDVLQPLEARVTITLENRAVAIRAWKKEIRGVFRSVVPVYLLDTQLESNSAWDRQLTDCLYGGDQRYRLCQEAVLGLGGVVMLDALGHRDVQVFHMNEGHSALLTLGLLARSNADGRIRDMTPEAAEAVRRRCVFTTHTPVPAGHDQFPFDLVRNVLGPDVVRAIQESGCCWHDTLNMTYLALRLSRYVNGVAQRHSEISRGMFPQTPINAITNGVHAVTWTSSPFQQLYDRHIPEWRHDNHYLRYIISAPLHEIQQAHADAKRVLLEEVRRRTGVELSHDVMTIGFARRAALYKRADLLFADRERLLRIDRDFAPLQILFAGKAHPRDDAGKALIQHVYEAAAAFGSRLPVVYLPDYDMRLAQLLCAGADLWLNTPQKPQEASGTSGMKAALNGVPSLSVLDGWWIEGHVEGVTGWSIDEDFQAPSDSVQESNCLYQKLERVILPLYYRRGADYAKVMRAAIALNGAFFNAQRMLSQYARNAYWPRNGSSR